MKRILPLIACAVLATTLLGAEGERETKKAAATASDDGVIRRGTIRAVKLPEVKFELPPGKGRETVTLQCAVCHTLAYIPMQPPFSRETWTAVVTKMQKTYSAPIPDDKIPEIVDYLVGVRGAK